MGRLDREGSENLLGAPDAYITRWIAVWWRGPGLERQRLGWATKFEIPTPRYTTRVDELPIAMA